MGEKIKQLYRNAKMKPPKGKGEHTEAFHKRAIAIKKSNPEYSMDIAYATAMKQLGRNKAVNPSHWSENVKKNKKKMANVQRRQARRRG